KRLASVLLNLFASFSAGETAVIQKGLLFRRGGAAECGIAMREPTEAADNVCMNFRPLQVVNISGCLVKREAAFLIGEILGMFKREVKEATQFYRHLAIETPDDGAGSDSARQRIGGKGSRLATEHIARELIKQNQQRQRTLRGFLPVR